jgi:hypothetical protein
VLAEEEEFAFHAADHFEQAISEADATVLDAQELFGFLVESPIEENLSTQGTSQSVASLQDFMGYGWNDKKIINLG